MGEGHGVAVDWRKDQSPEKGAEGPKGTGWGRVKSLKAEAEKQIRARWGEGGGGNGEKRRGSVDG